MRSAACLGIFCFAILLALCGHASPLSWMTQTADPAKEKPEELAGTRWDGSIDWTEKGRFQRARIDVPYSEKVSFRFQAGGMCTNNKAQPCKWEKNGQTITITVGQTKKACQGSASLTLKDNEMSGTWAHYSGFTCFLIPPPRNIKLRRHQ
jgi:hypothetical protein